MSLYLITGISGSGKSTVIGELKQLGYEAYDFDEAGPATAKWRNDTTGFVHPKSSIKKEDRTADFVANHSWKVPRSEVAELAAQADTKTIFLGGGVANESELQDLFKTIFALAIDDKTLRHRLANRTNNDWGKNSHELAYTLDVNRELEERYQRLGYVVISANQPTTTIVDEILSYVNDN